ncbi:DNA cytosine methyltransferase [Pseudomonas aeruginosa]|nr:MULTISPECIES: DNA cytosine methyltransferase [Pseudomonas aeruginosa group]MDH0906482.1 DNA cytosine methyltransferase [Pseudomonas aeruginosa]MDH1219591.1 DNA cytosine methyltransferase [Pseudomonas aeruginosa]MDH1224849.1 DNA cytosine methyltransferase [Pseudomonas aeruginosa]
MNELALFSGAGGGILGGHLLGWRTVCAVEFEPYAASVLAARQNDGILPPFPIWDDVRTFDGRPWRGLVDVVSGGFPCQDISAAGNGAGIDGERSGLWREMARIVGEVRPRFVFVENSPLLVRRGLAVVLGDLTELGYDARWCVMGAADVGAPHQRDRIWIVAHSNDRRYWKPVQQIEQSWSEKSSDAGGYGEAQPLAYPNSVWQLQPTRRITNQRNGIGECSSVMENAECLGCEQMEQRVYGRTSGKGSSDKAEHSGISGRRCGWPAEPNVGRVANGVASRVDRIKALGNGQVPRVAATAFTYLASEWI